MPHITNCSLVHSGREPGPCKLCGTHDLTKRYVHMCQKKDRLPAYYEYVKEHHSIEDDDCICRKCDAKLTAKFTRDSRLVSSCSTLSDCASVAQDPCVSISGSCFLSALHCDISCRVASVEPHKFKNCFKLWDSSKQPLPHSIDTKVTLCEHHYREYQKCVYDINCCICDKSLKYSKKFVNISPDKHDHFNLYIIEELNVEKEIDFESMIVCLSCYRSYNLFSKSTNFTLIHAQSDGFLVDCLQEFDEIDIKSVDVTNIDLFCFRMILAEVVNKFLTYKPLLLQSLYSEYCGHVSKLCNTLNISLNVDSENRARHDIRWIFKMLKSCLGSALHYWVPEGLKTGRMVYRVGTDFMRCAHSQLHGHKKSIDELQAVNKALQIKLDDLSESLQAMKKIECLDETLKITRQCIKSYVSSSVNSSELPDIRCFDVHDEIRKLDPVLWNFIYRLTANEIEEKELRRDVFNSWENSYLGIDDSCLRLFPRLFIASCIFNAQSSKCGQPLHLLLSDVLDKYSGSSTELLAISNRLGATVSKESLRRFISSRCIQLDKEPNLLSSDSFTVASFDNLDKNQKYAIVGTGANKSGFHGTTIQAVTPKPSVKHDFTYVPKPSESGDPDQSASDTCVKSVSRSIPSDLIKALREPGDNIGEPSNIKVNRFTRLSLDDFSISEVEKVAWDKHVSDLSAYCFSKSVLKTNHIVVPGLKAYLAYDCSQTEVSEFHSIAVLDETADSKATVELTLNILYGKFQVGTKINYLVVVGDGKSYDILIKLKSEYGNALDWVLPYPGDWHILKNLLPVFMKIYYDAGLKELAVKFHHGATLKVLTECTRFPMTHRFLSHVWEAMFRYQVESFMRSHRSPGVACFDNDFQKIISVILESADITVSRDCNGNLEGDIQDFKVWSSVLEQKDRFSMMLQGVQVEFDEWRKLSSEKSETFRFWDTFIHVDFMAYLGLYLAIREQNWDLRNASLKNLACLFTAFDRHNYMRMIPYHFADLLTFPVDVIHHFKAGCFAVSLSGDNFFSVALDEAHEMEINLKTKKAINTFSLPSLTAMTYYLPYRAESLHNLKVQLDIESGQSGKRKELSKSYIHSEEQTIFQYVENLKVSSLFVDDLVGGLHHIFTHTTASSDQADSLLRYRYYGSEDMNNYIQCFLIRVPDISVKQPHRKRRNLKTFSSPKVTVHKQKKEIKDNKTVISCLRKQIAFSKLSSEPVSDLDQFLALPRAICDAEGIPMKGQKSLSLHHFRSRYPDAFLSALPTEAGLTAVILEGMFMINSNPAPQHKNFGDYAKFIFDRWIVRSYKQFSASEIHVVFDHPNRHGCSPKDVERSRRDSSVQTSDPTVLSSVIHTGLSLPSSWRSFLANRENKRNLVNFLSYELLRLASPFFIEGSCTVITAGGFDDDNHDKALGISCLHVGIVEFAQLSGNHEEGDTRVWLHASQAAASRVVIYSPDTDTFFIGLPIVKSLKKSVFVQTKETPYEKTFIDMMSFLSLLSHDLSLQGIHHIESCIQMLYICSGCDFVSFFHGCGKKAFLDGFYQNAQFIAGDLNLSTHDETGLCSFYRLVASVYFAKHRPAFRPSASISELYNTIELGDGLESHTALVKIIREHMWERIQSEDNMLPNSDALQLHWDRSCWVAKYWKQAFDNSMHLEPIDKSGWIIKNTTVSVVWDSDVNIDKVEKTIKWYTKGCSCKSGCTTNRCSCKKSGFSVGGYCGPGCKCQNCKNIASCQNELPELFDELECFSDTELDACSDIDSDSNSDEGEDEVQIAPSHPSEEFQQYWDTFGFLTGELVPDL
ncbi:unnamed protein product [Mytilus edulis]|uniref:Tesmin/TSO1-like CXC domain-containing protein n=1 Tax=Mytilus edulis TaxID=6550 RepID=A0A8S3PSK8_MYTED|nr:unnamed protein product [Mytilus edulis]